MAFGKCGEFKMCTIFAKFIFVQLCINDIYAKARDRAAGRSQKEILAAWVEFRLRGAFGGETRQESVGSSLAKESVTLPLTRGGKLCMISTTK